MIYETAYDKELYHYGVKGMKWGVRNYYNKTKDPVLKKGTIINRVIVEKDDPTTAGRKYFSPTKQGHKLWEKYLAGYTNEKRYIQKYKINQDIRVATPNTAFKTLKKLTSEDPEFKTYAELEIRTILSKTADCELAKLNNKDIPSLMISLQRFKNTATADLLTKELRNQGYGATLDGYGISTVGGKNSMIIFDPDKLVSKVGKPRESIYSRLNPYSKDANPEDSNEYVNKIRSMLDVEMKARLEDFFKKPYDEIKKSKQSEYLKKYLND